MPRRAPSFALKRLDADAAAIWPSASYERLRRRILLAAAAFALLLVIVQASWVPREYELGSASSCKYRLCPRFKLSDVRKWLDSRALW
jgi:hypothetical protein